MLPQYAVYLRWSIIIIIIIVIIIKNFCSLYSLVFIVMRDESQMARYIWISIVEEI
jgi:hypothetical protein